MPYQKIPRKLVTQGIEHCKKNVVAYLEDAKLIISKGRLCHAFLSVQLGIEELGKAVILKEEYSKQHTDFILVDAAVFGKDGGKGHKLKASKAWQRLDPSLKNLHEGAFEEGGFSEYGFDLDTESSHHTRLKCAYVDFIEEEQIWWVGETLDESRLLSLIDNIEEAVKNI